MALYICVIATCRTLAEWRAILAAFSTPPAAAAGGGGASRRGGAAGGGTGSGAGWGLHRFSGLLAAHLASGVASVLVTGLLNTWLPLLGHGAAAAVVWLHLLLLPAVMVTAMSVAAMPGVVGAMAGGEHMGLGFVPLGSRRRCAGVWP